MNNRTMQCRYCITKLERYCWVYVVQTLQRERYFIGGTSNLLDKDWLKAKAVDRFGFKELVWVYPTDGIEEARLLECYVQGFSRWARPNKEQYAQWRAALSPAQIEDIIDERFYRQIALVRQR